jgi:hypothetical protein
MFVLSHFWQMGGLASLGSKQPGPSGGRLRAESPHRAAVSGTDDAAEETVRLRCVTTACFVELGLAELGCVSLATAIRALRVSLLRSSTPAPTLHHGSANASEIKACFSRWTIDEVSETFSRVFTILRRNADVDGRRGVSGEPFFLTAALCCDSGST